MYDLKVIIIGAGIGGLTTGIALRQAGFEVEVYDRVKELREVGAGISLWSNGVKVLNQLGLSKQIASIGGLMDKMQYYDRSGTLLNDIDLQPLIDEVGQRPYPVARADLQKMLIDALACEVRLNSQCIKIEQTPDKVTAFFEDGHHSTGDVLIAADGIRSVLRKDVLQAPVEPRYAGYINWNGLVPFSPDLAEFNSWVIYVGDYKRASMMPVGGNRFYFFFDVPLASNTPRVGENSQDELTHYFQGWPEKVQNLIAKLDPQKVNRLLIHDLGPIDRLVNGRVALLGDAAHATCPDLGQGGCQAMEDAYILAQSLVTNNISVEDSLQRYEAQRKERVKSIVEKARKRAEMIHGKDPQVTQQWYEQLGKEKPTEVTGAIAKTILGGPLH